MAFNTFILEMDILWDWVKPFKVGVSLIKFLRKKGKQILLLTDISLYPKKKIIQLLKNGGMEFKESELITSMDVIAEFLFLKRAKIWTIGNGLKEELKSRGIEISENPEYLVIGDSLNVSAKDFSLAYKIVRKDTKIIITSKRNLIKVGEEIYPSVNAYSKIMEIMTGKKTILFGEPSNYMLSFLDLFVASPRDEVILIGRELDTTIRMGKIGGYYTVLLGKEKRRDVKPDKTISSLEEIKKFID